MDEGAKARAARRGSWPIVATTLTADDDETVAMTPSERVAMVWRLTLDAWAMSGKPMPRYRRAKMPGRMIRRRGRA